MAVISHGLCSDPFRAGPAVVGRRMAARVVVDRPLVPLEVIGVAPQSFDFPQGTEIWVPAAPFIRFFAARRRPGRSVHVLRVFFAIGRMKPGTTGTRRPT